MTPLASLVVGLASILVAIPVVRLSERFARRREILDRPDWRSAHDTPTPRLGGIGILAGLWAGVIGAALLGHLDGPSLALLGGATLIGGVGLVDDLRPLPALARLVAQAAIALGLAVAVGGPLVVDLPATSWRLEPPISTLVGATWIVAVVNAWNFMDGIDGLVAGSTVVVALAMALLGGPPAATIALAGAAAGFLVWNRPPASIFMGDSGSLSIGFVLGGSVLVGAPRVPLVTAAIVLAPLILDAGFTLGRRLVAGEDVLAAHHDHLYQRLSRSGIDRRAIALGYWAAAASCAGLAALYVRGSATVQVAVVAGLGVLFGGYVVWVGRVRG